MMAHHPKRADLPYGELAALAATRGYSLGISVGSLLGRAPDQWRQLGTLFVRVPSGRGNHEVTLSERIRGDLQGAAARLLTKILNQPSTC